MIDSDEGTIDADSVVKVGSKWAFLNANELLTFAFIDSDAADCAGTAIPERTMGDGFTTDAAGNGGFHNAFDTISLSGENSIVGKYLQVNNSSGQAACCLIELQEAKATVGTDDSDDEESSGKNGGRNGGKNGGKGRHLASVVDFL